MIKDCGSLELSMHKSSLKASQIFCLVFVISISISGTTWSRTDESLYQRAAWMCADQLCVPLYLLWQDPYAVLNLEQRRWEYFSEECESRESSQLFITPEPSSMFSNCPQYAAQGTWYVLSQSSYVWRPRFILIQTDCAGDRRRYWCTMDAKSEHPKEERGKEVSSVSITTKSRRD